MRFWTGMSIQKKLPLAIVFMVAATIVPLSTVAYLTSRNLVIESLNAGLSAVAHARAVRVSDFLHSIDNGLAVQASDPVVAEAIQDFTEAFTSLDAPRDSLQAAYITDNPHPTGEKDKLLEASTGTPYDAVHSRFHPLFSTLKDSMGYYDVFLFDTDGNLIYSVYKELDYATNFYEGEWAESGLGEVFRLANERDAAADAVFVDFAPYGPSYGAAAAFMSRPVFASDGSRLGVIAYQMPINYLNEAASSQIGETGHTYLVGADGFLRSDSPLTEEDDILKTRVDNPAVAQEAQGESDLLRYEGGAGQIVQGMFEPVDFHGVSWALVAEQAETEMFAQLPRLVREQALIGGIFLAGAILLSVFLSRGVSLPLRRTVDSVGRIADKDYDFSLSDSDRGDEIGDIAQALDRFRGSLRDAEAATVEAAFKGAAFEATGGPMILCDLGQKIVGANSAFVRLLEDNPDDFGVAGLDVSKSTLVGQSLRDFSFLPEAVMAEMHQDGALPIRQKLNIGESYIGLLVDFVVDQEGAPIGFVVDLKNQTFQMASQVLVDAIDGQQARLELDLGGRIKRFNGHFEKLMQTTPDKIRTLKGQNVIRAEDDVDIWSLAQGGTAHIGRFLVTGDGPRRIVDGSFTPVPDQNGATSGYLLIGADVTEAREQFLEAEKVAKRRSVELASVVDKLSVGLRELSSGNLTGVIEDAFAEEYEQLRVDFNEAAARLKNAIGEVVINAASIGEEADGISASVADLSKRTESQAATLEQTAAAMHQLTSSVASSAQGAASAAKIANDARQNAQASSGVVRETADAMKEIEASSQEVTKIISVIDDIAFQTNLLALNAGVEAARAGSAGRGFAVVASEVRALAQRCLEASNEISSLISASGQHVERGVSLVSKTASELENIAASVLEISDNVGQIAQASSEQSHGLSEINEALNQLDQATQQNAAMSEETSAAAQALSSEARHLTEVTQKFQTGEGDRRSRSTSRAA